MDQTSAVRAGRTPPPRVGSPVPTSAGGLPLLAAHLHQQQQQQPSAAAAPHLSHLAVTASGLQQAVPGSPLLPAASSHLPLHQPPLPRLLSRNANGTVVWTSSPGNEAELQLYRVMQRASLLAYYDTLLEMGGDDVQQLCEAGEEEFLEIMALVGMASKPLHVRRLQKALQEWLTNPSMFRSPLSPSPPVVSPSPACPPTPPPQSPSPAIVHLPTDGVANCRSPESPGSPGQPAPVLLETQVGRLAEAARALVSRLPLSAEPKSHTAKRKMGKDLESVLAMPEDDPRRMELIRKYAAIYGRFDCKRKPEKPLTLHEVSVNEAAAQICRYRPALLTRRDELFPLARQVVRDSGYHYSKGHSKSYLRSGVNGDTPSAKRGRFEGGSPEYEEALRRRQERLEEIAEELRVVKERSEELSGRGDCGDSPDAAGAHQSSSSSEEALTSRRAQLLAEQSLLVNQCLQSNRLYSRGSSSGKLLGGEAERADTDDTDSQLSFSNHSSPLPEDLCDSRDSTRRGGDCGADDEEVEEQTSRNGRGGGERKTNDSGDESCGKESNHCTLHPEDNGYENSFYQEKVKVIASSGGNIIAVANPALSMSPAISIENGRTPPLKKDPLTPFQSKIS